MVCIAARRKAFKRGTSAGFLHIELAPSFFGGSPFTTNCILIYVTPAK
jgi:hypothetical protein